MDIIKRLKVYLAGPFFSPEQLELIVALEQEIREAGYELFSPRLGDNAVMMNELIRSKIDPSRSLRESVFADNVDNIEDADLMVAVIDGFDSGVLFEMGFAYRAHVPIVSFTARDYGSNLMLAHSIIAHIKSIDSLREVLQLAKSLSSEVDASTYAKCVAMIQQRYLTPVALREGPEERSNG